jgi:2-amino-4-hydroxy-6-hydroxymethyldihydropteridine diphosphokinase
MATDALEGPSPLDAVIGLGANLGEPEPALLRAVHGLGLLGRLVAVSGLYRTEPVGGPPQPDFLNAAARLCFPGTARELLERLLELERQEGRERRERWGPRTLDLDILWLRGARISEPGLSVPHPRLRERTFALRPLLDVAPDAVDPLDGAVYQHVLEGLGSAGIGLVRRDWTEAVLGQMTARPGMDRPCP